MLVLVCSTAALAVRFSPQAESAAAAEHQVAMARRRQELLRYAAGNNARFLRSGDRVEATVGTDDGVIDLGTQHNLVVDAAA